MGYDKDSPKRCISLSVYIRQIKENPSNNLLMCLRTLGKKKIKQYPKPYIGINNQARVDTNKTETTNNIKTQLNEELVL